MAKYKVSLVVAVVFIGSLLPISFSVAQQFQAGGNVLLGFPQAEFSQNVDNTGYGFSGFFAARLGALPLCFGGSFGFLIYGNETRKEPFSSTIPDVTVDVKTSNNIVLGHLLVRFQVPNGVFRPYLDGLVGFHYLFTSTSIKSENNPEEEIASSTNFQDIAFSFGMGGGAQIRVYDNPEKRKPDGKRNLSEVLIDLRISYLSGGEAEYLKEGSIRREGAQVSYDVKQSRTDLLAFKLGVVFTF